MKHAHRIGRAFAALVLLAAATRTPADGPRIAATAGAGSAFGQTYYELGARVGYDVGIGLTPEVGLSYWGGSSPSFVQLTPGVTWYFPLPLIRPYLGAFYEHDFVSSGFPDQDGVGIRGGIGIFGAGPLFVTIGAAWERRLSCSFNCDTWWPEALAGVSF